MKHRPTAEEKSIIIKCAQFSAGMRSVFLEVGERWNIDRKNGDAAGNRSINIALISDHPDWDDTDLFETLKWKWFCRGIPMTDDGRAIVDFYVYNRGIDVELQTNVTAYWKDGKMVRVDGTLNGAIWQDGSFTKRSPLLN